LEQEEDQDAVECVQNHVEEVVTRWIFAVHRIIDSVGQHDDRAVQATLPFYRLPVMPAEDLFKVGPVQPLNGCVSLDDDSVVKDEFTAYRIGVGKKRRQH